MNKETDGNQASTQSSGHNRGSAAQEQHTNTSVSDAQTSAPQEIEDYLRGYATALVDAIAAISYARDVGVNQQLSDGGLDAAHDGLNAAIFVIRQMRPPATSPLVQTSTQSSEVIRAAKKEGFYARLQRRHRAR